MKKSRFLQQDKTEKFLSSPRQEGTWAYFTGAGDDITNGIRGAGQHFEIDNTVNPSTTKTVEIQFLESVWLKDGILMWDGAQFGDTLSLEIVLPAGTPFLSDSGYGNADMVNGTVVNITASPTPDETWVGAYILFPIDVTLFRFVNNLHIMGSNHHGLILENSDSAEVQPDLKFKMTLNSPNSSPVKIAATMEVYRATTV